MDIFRRAYGKNNNTIHVDGWTSDRGRRTFSKAAELGWVTRVTVCSDQYTAINFTITEKGRAILSKKKKS